MNIHCWKCDKILTFSEAKIGFREECPFCGIDLHTCKNCKHYYPGKPNDCLVPGTEWIKDREARNFCEDFSLNTKRCINKNSSKTGRDNFNSLFKDDNN